MGQVLEGQGQGREAAERGRGLQAGPGSCRQGGKPGLSQGKGLQDTAGKCQDKVSRCLVPPSCSTAKNCPHHGVGAHRGPLLLVGDSAGTKDSPAAPQKAERGSTVQPPATGKLMAGIRGN